MQAIHDFFMGPYTDLPNHLVSFQRFFSTGLTIVATVLLILIFRKKSKKAQRWVLTVLSITVFVTEVINKTLRYLQGSHDLIKLLVPMQFSSLVIYLMMLSAVIRKQWFLNITTIGVLFAGIAYLALPGAGMNTTPIRMIAFNSIYTHCVDFVFGIFAIYFNLAKFPKKDLWQPAVLFVFSAIYGGLLNLVIYPGSTYFYLSVPEYRAFVPFMPYEILLALAVVLYTFILYYTYHKRTQKAERQQIILHVPQTKTPLSGNLEEHENANDIVN